VQKTDQYYPSDRENRYRANETKTVQLPRQSRANRKEL